MLFSLSYQIKLHHIAFFLTPLILKSGLRPCVYILISVCVYTRTSMHGMYEASRIDVNSPLVDETKLMNDFVCDADTN